jgi:hypothetical protein
VLDCKTYGWKQQIYTTKKASSPTVAIESLLISCVNDSKQGKYVAIVDIPGAFIQVDMDEGGAHATRRNNDQTHRKPVTRNIPKV